MTSQPIQKPVTGQEDLGNLDMPLQALSQFYRALNDRSLSMLSDNWDLSEDASMDNPLGGIKRGWKQIESVYSRIFQEAATFHFEFYDYTLHQGADYFYVVGRERGQYTIGNRSLTLAIRTTRFFRKNGDRWRQIHHHGSIDDPSSLEAYQKAVAQA